MIVNNVLELIGNTPLVKIDNFKKHFNLECDIYLKLESKNPAGSIKDRASLYMVKDLLLNNKIDKKTEILEATSGNTGIGLSMILAYLGYKLIIFMPESMSLERRLLMSAYGTKLVLTPKELGMAGAIKACNEYHEQNKNSFIIDQFNNQNNVLAHYEMTGKEIIKDLPDITHFIAACGTGGTVTGVGKYLKETKENIKIISGEPELSPFLTRGQKGAHKIEGIGAGFKPNILNLNIIDEIYTVTNEEAYEMARLLPKLEGLLVGISTGANLMIALKANLKKGDKVVVISPDGGDRYLSTTLYK